MTDVYEVEEDYFLLGNTAIYQVEKFLGEGGYGKVAQCKKLGTDELFAIKIILNKLSGEHELKALEKIRQLDADKHNLVSFIDDFTYKNHTCVVFEMLEQSLFHFIKERTTKYLELHEIRIVAEQLLVALDGLKSINIVHCDIKMDNIMLVNHKSQPFKLKLIDFGLAKKTKMLKTGAKIQNLTYRAPEVILGLPLDERLDLWTVGYILSYLYTGFLLHPKDCEYNVLRAMVGMQGIPDGSLLNQGLYSKEFFYPALPTTGPVWELYSPTQYMKLSGKKIRLQINNCTFQDLIDGCGDESMRVEAERFMDLLRQMIEIDPNKRITPSDALKHPFIIMDPVKSGNAKDVKSNPEDAGLENGSFASSSSSTLGYFSVKNKMLKNFVPFIDEVRDESQASCHVDGKTFDIQHLIEPNELKDESITEESYVSAEDGLPPAGKESTPDGSPEMRSHLSSGRDVTYIKDHNEPGPFRENDILPDDNRTFVIQHEDELMSVEVKKCSVTGDASATDESYVSAEGCSLPAGNESTPGRSSEMESYHSAQEHVTWSKDNEESEPFKEKAKGKGFKRIRNLCSRMMRGLRTLGSRRS